MTDANATATRRAVATVLTELVNGAHADATFVLNRSDAGLIDSLDRLSAGDASRIPPGHCSSIAAHVDHLRYGIGLLNRWGQGEDPFRDADYSVSWRTTTVSDSQWAQLRADLRSQLAAWAETIQRPRSLTDLELTGIVSSVVHLAYHFGAIRQIAPLIAGPRATR